MDLLTVTIVAGLLLLAAGVMMLSHVRAWRAFRQEKGDCPHLPERPEGCFAQMGTVPFFPQEGLDAEDFDYRRRQFRRRMQTSAMLGLLAIALPAGMAITTWLRSGWVFLFYCLAMILLVCWVILLALVDAWATKHHFGRLRDKCMVEKLRLEAEVRRIQAAKGNGEAE